MKKIGKIIITALLIILCVGAFGSLATILDKPNIGGGSNDGGFVDTTETNLYVGLKKLNGSFTENPFTDAWFLGWSCEDYETTSMPEEIPDDYKDVYFENDIDILGLADSVEYELYPDSSNVIYQDSTIITELWVVISLNENYYFEPLNKEFEVFGVNDCIIVTETNEKLNFENLNGSKKIIDCSELNGKGKVTSMLFNIGSMDYEMTHDAYVLPLMMSYNSMYINIIENNVSVFENTFRTDNYYFDENDKYEGYALMDLSILTDKYCNNKSFYNWNKIDGNYILIRTLDGSTNIVSNSYELDKQGLYLFGLPTSHNGTISVNWSADYE